jgi:hypothetical protein
MTDYTVLKKGFFRFEITQTGGIRITRYVGQAISARHLQYHPATGPGLPVFPFTKNGVLHREYECRQCDLRSLAHGDDDLLLGIAGGVTCLLPGARPSRRLLLFQKLHTGNLLNRMTGNYWPIQASHSGGTFRPGNVNSLRSPVISCKQLRMAMS